MRLPVHQVREGQRRPAQLAMQPHAEVMESHLRDQARLQPAEVMGPFPIKAEGMMELLVHRLHALAHPSEPTPEPRGPRRPPMALGGTEDLGAISPPPCRLLGLPLATLLDAVRSAGWGPNTRQTRVGLAAAGKDRLRQGLLLCPRSTTPAAGDHPPRVDRQEYMAALIPAQAVAPAAIGSAR